MRSELSSDVGHWYVGEVLVQSVLCEKSGRAVGRSVATDQCQSAIVRSVRLGPICTPKIDFTRLFAVARLGVVSFAFSFPFVDLGVRLVFKQGVQDGFQEAILVSFVIRSDE